MVEPSPGALPPQTHTLPIDERIKLGRALRERLARKHHGAWKPAADRRDPIEILIEQGKLRAARPAARALRANEGDALHLPARRGCRDGGRSRGHAGERPDGAGRRRLPLSQLRRLRHARTPARLRHQRFRRDRGGAVGMGSQAPGHEFRRRHARRPDKEARTELAEIVARSYRETMAEVAAMPVLAAWYQALNIDDEDTAEAIGIGARAVRKASTARTHPVEIAAIGHRAGTAPRIDDNPEHGVYHPAPADAAAFRAAVEAVIGGLRRIAHARASHAPAALSPGRRGLQGGWAWARSARCAACC